MTLRACSRCRRHFRAEPACPFCGAAAPPPAPRVVGTHRLSRAAAFAGAALAGCYVSNPPPQYGPPPPAEQQQMQPPPPPVEQRQNFADPPPPPPPAVTGTSRIEGTVSDGSGKGPRPFALQWVYLRPQTPVAGFKPRQVQTDGNGRYAFVDLPAGSYVVTVGSSNHPRQPPPQRVVTVTDNDVQIADLTVYPYVPPDHSNMPMPYGAPPARMRMV